MGRCKKKDLVESLRFMKYLPGLFLVKNLDSEFIGMSDSFANFVGWKNSEQSLGKLDIHLPCKAAECADTFIAQDMQVIRSNSKMLNLEINEFADGLQIILAQKAPFKDENGEIVAAFCQAIDVSNVKMFKRFKGMSIDDKRILDSSGKPATYALSPENCPLQDLSSRQQECVFWLVRGKTTKEIGDLLEISSRTVEHYVNCIKYKLGCDTKGQVIEKAIDAGFLFYIPKSFVQYEFVN